MRLTSSLKHAHTDITMSERPNLMDMNGKCIVAKYVCFVVQEIRDYLRLWTPRSYIRQ